MRDFLPVSVVVPCYNVADTLERAVLSVLLQTRLPKEIILVDDKSNDDTWHEMVRLQVKYGDITIIKIYQNEVNCGAGETRNYGWEKANEEYIAFLDADDAWFAYKLEIQYDVMRKNPNLTMSCHRMANNVDRYEINDYDVCLINKHLALYKNPIMTPSVMIKRNIKLRFKKGKRYSEDCWLWNHILMSNLQVMYIKAELARVYKNFYGDSGLGNALLEMERGEINNYIDLYKEGLLNCIYMYSAIIFSLLKFIKRLMVVGLRKVCMK